jgi:hypothetical protein
MSTKSTGPKFGELRAPTLGVLMPLSGLRVTTSILLTGRSVKVLDFALRDRTAAVLEEAC